MKHSSRWLLALGFGSVLVTCALFRIAAASEPEGKEETAENWAFRRLRRPALPAVNDPAWPRNPIDHFVLARLEAKKLAPTAETDRLTLLKRVTYDLTGLSPTTAEREAFLNDPSSDAYEKVVERLLNSPRFGERWAQLWLDVVRYSETEGFKIDRYRPDAWRYRDYVIRAFNDDMPYDRFVHQQLAGDELDPDNSDAILATGYLRLFPEESNGANYRQIRQDILDDVVETTGLAFLGLTVGCAKCHDHKFDPISQEDYFHFQAFFAGMLPADDVPLLHGKDEKVHRDRMIPWDNATKAIRAELDQILSPVGKEVFEESVVALDEDTQIALKTPESKRTPMQMQLATYGGKQIFRKHEKMHRRLSGAKKERFEELKKQLASFDHLKPTPMPTAMAVRETGSQVPPTHRLSGGDFRRPREKLEPAFLECLDEKTPTIRPPSANPDSSGRRLAFARWLTEPDHPLTSRVIVNRLWQQYFERGIVASPSDFGVQGQKPTHPELLDWLASELVAKDWSLKAIHRLIVTSAVYRQSSASDTNAVAAEANKLDPENHLLWHARVRRRDAESIRDTALQVSGLLNERMFGESACPELPPSIMQTSRAWYPDEKVEDRNRRSVYVFNRRNLTYPLFAAFDAPNRSLSCATRNSTISATQALLMLNGEFS